MLAAEKYVALCLGFHGTGQDNATSAKQSTDKRYITDTTVGKVLLYLPGNYLNTQV